MRGSVDAYLQDFPCFDSPFALPPVQIVHDFSNSAIALRWCFGTGLAIRQVLDLQLAFEAVYGRVDADSVSVVKAFGQEPSCSDDTTSRCHLLPFTVVAAGTVE